MRHHRGFLLLGLNKYYLNFETLGYGNFCMKLFMWRDDSTCVNNNLSFAQNYEQDAKHCHCEIRV